MSELFLLILAGSFVGNLLFGGKDVKVEFHDNVVQTLVNLVKSVSPDNSKAFIEIGEEIVKRFPEFTNAVNATLVYHSAYCHITSNDYVEPFVSEEVKHWCSLYQSEPTTQTQELILSILYMKVQIYVAMVYFNIGESNLNILNATLEQYPHSLSMLQVYEIELNDICKFLHVDKETDKVVPKLDRDFVPRHIVMVKQ